MGKIEFSLCDKESGYERAAMGMFNEPELKIILIEDIKEKCIEDAISYFSKKYHGEYKIAYFIDGTTFLKKVYFK